MDCFTLSLILSYYLKDYKSRKRCTWGPKNAPPKGGGAIKFKKKSHKSSRRKGGEKVKKKNKVGWLTIFLKMKGAD